MKSGNIKTKLPKLCRLNLHKWSDPIRTDRNEEDLAKENYQAFWDQLFYGWNMFVIYKKCRRCGKKVYRSPNTGKFNVPSTRVVSQKRKEIKHEFE